MIVYISHVLYIFNNWNKHMLSLKRWWHKKKKKSVQQNIIFLKGHSEANLWCRLFRKIDAMKYLKRNVYYENLL